MTIAEARKEKRGYFSIYKKGQGKWVRWSTVAGMALIVGIGAIWLGHYQLAAYDFLVQFLVGTIWVLLGAWLTFWIVNTPKLAEFFIMTESEMRKVTWPTRKEVVTSTKVIILLTVILGVLLYLVDVEFIGLFNAIKLTAN